ncbi:hypothetical protein PQQ75_25100 [Paraburkholderia aspalathi]|uniref:hypothetical protein n=1 Tax=Paraburkholderia aspalathi TaxID=1324617 RepID=UPI0038B776D5
MTTAKDTAPSTPSATWRANGEPDPHFKQYDCERATLTLGTLTDDELANGAFMNYDRRQSLSEMLNPQPGQHMPIVWMTAAKERIRWLSRALERALAPATEPPVACKGINCGSTDGASHSAECQSQHDAAVAGAVRAEAEQVPDNKVAVARMGYGAVAVGECLSNETGEPGIIYMALDDVGPIGRDTSDVYPMGSTPPSDRVLAYVSFKTPEAVDQTISILEGMKSKYWPDAIAARSGDDAAQACELCKGVGQVGIPGQRCFACGGSGKSKFTAPASSAGDREPGA